MPRMTITEQMQAANAARNDKGREMDALAPLIWIGGGILGWVFFGYVGKIDDGVIKMNPCDEPSFWFLMLPLCLIVPLAGWGVAVLISATER